MRAGEPLVATVSLVNSTDKLCITPLSGWAYEGPAWLRLVGLQGDTWLYHPNDFCFSRAWAGPALFGIGPRDSVYRRYVMLSLIHI